MGLGLELGLGLGLGLAVGTRVRVRVRVRARASAKVRARARARLSAAHRRGERLGLEGQLPDVFTKPVALRKALPEAEAPPLGRLHDLVKVRVRVKLGFRVRVQSLHHPVAVALLGREQPA